MVSQGIAVSWPDATPVAHAKALNDLLHEWLPTTSEYLDNFDGGGWEIVSHDFLPLEDGTVLSVLARRAAKPS